MRATVSKFEEWRTNIKEYCLRLFHPICGRHGNMQSSRKWYYIRHTYQVSSLCVLSLESLRREEVNLKKSAWGYLLLFTNMYCCDFSVGDWIRVQSFVHIAHTICELYWHMWSIILYCPGLFVAVYKEISMTTLRITDTYILTKFHYFMLFHFWVMGVESEEEEEEGGEEDEQNSLSFIALYIYDARYTSGKIISSKWRGI